MAYEPMTAARLAEHQRLEHRRDYSVSDDGWDDIRAAERAGWTALPSWGRDGWDLGNWPYVSVCVRDLPGSFQLMQIVEGDHTAYSFDSAEERDAAVDYLFLWYAAGRCWAPLTEADRDELDRGELVVDDKWRGPFRDEGRQF